LSVAINALADPVCIFFWLRIEAAMRIEAFINKINKRQPILHHNIWCAFNAAQDYLPCGSVGWTDGKQTMRIEGL